MYLTINENVSFGVRIPIHQFTELARKHLENIPNTLNIEASANFLKENDFPEIETKEFITKVCKWGNYPGIATRVINNNHFESIQNAFENALEEISNNNIESALTSINQLNGLGKPSFASKHLRFLNPENCPVYDNVLNCYLPYPYNPCGYSLFASDCKKIARSLEQLTQQNPFERNQNRWFAADVEAALFYYFKEQ